MDAVAKAVDILQGWQGLQRFLLLEDEERRLWRAKAQSASMLIELFLTATEEGGNGGL